MNKAFLKTKSTIDHGIARHFSQDQLLDSAIRYAMDEGKRIRPILLCQTYQGMGLELDDTTFAYALALEMIHNYSLIHDDLPAMDDDDFRRGRETVHKKYGEATAILAGDRLLNEAYEVLFSAIPSTPSGLDAAKTIAKYSGINGMIGGQVIDVDGSIPSVEKLLHMYELKTCGLLIAGAEAGALLGGGSDAIVSAMIDYGRNLGIAYQIRDDLLDREQDALIGKQTYVSFCGIEASQKAVEDYSKLARQSAKALPDPLFHLWLVDELVDRKQ